MTDRTTDVRSGPEEKGWSEPGILSKLKQSALLTDPKLRDEVIDEILQLKAAAAAAQQAADQWQARAERAEQRLERLRKSRIVRVKRPPLKPAPARA